MESFTHEMMLDPVPGLPSTVAVRIQNPKIVKVRLHIVVDEELFVVPLQGAAETEFTATFPSPKEKVRYSFQFVSEDEKTAMSQPYLRRQTCAQTSDPSTDVRSKLVAQATELETISEQLMYLTQSIEGLKQ